MVLEPELLAVGVRGWITDPKDDRSRYWNHIPTEPVGPSDWVLVFDTETTTDHVQRLRFGAWQLYWKGTLQRQGLFYDPDAITERELGVLRQTAADNGWEICEVTEWLT